MHWDLLLAGRMYFSTSDRRQRVRVKTLEAGGRKYCPYCPAMESTTSRGSDRTGLCCRAVPLEGARRPAVRHSPLGCGRPARRRRNRAGLPSFLPSLLPTSVWGCSQLQAPARRRHCCQALCMGQEGAGRWHPDTLCESPVGPGRGRGLLEQSQGSSGSLYLASLSLCYLVEKAYLTHCQGTARAGCSSGPGLEVQFYPRQGKQAEPGLFVRSE